MSDSPTSKPPAQTLGSFSWEYRTQGFISPAILVARHAAEHAALEETLR